MQQIIKFHDELKQLTIYIKNLILFKSDQSSSKVAHFRSFQGIVERRMGSLKLDKNFFNTNDSYFKSILNYMVTCGEISHIGNGYYMALKKRDVTLPISKVNISIGTSSNIYNKKSYYGVFVEESLSNKSIPLENYRYDHNYNQWLNIFKVNTDVPYLKNEEYFSPTKTGFKPIFKNDLLENNLYYCVSNPIGYKKEHYVICKKRDRLYGTFVNDHILKAKISLLLDKGYTPQYSVHLFSEEDNIYKIRLSDTLPNVERDLVYLFSMPQKLNFSRAYYVHQKFVDDFIYILKKLQFRRKDSE